MIPLLCLVFTLPSCARRSAHRHSEGEALGGETENLLQIKQFSILRISKRVRNKFMYITTHLIDFITINGVISGVCKGVLLRTHKEIERGMNIYLAPIYLYNCYHNKKNICIGSI